MSQAPRKIPRPPATLERNGAGATLWKATLAEFELDQVELNLLGEVCTIADLAEGWRSTIPADKSEWRIVDRMGKPVSDPSLVEYTRLTQVKARLLAQLTKITATKRAGAVSQQALAANARWAKARGQVA